MYLGGDVSCAPWSVQLGAPAGMCLAGSRPPSLPTRTQLWGCIPVVSTADLTGLLVAFPVGTVLLVPASARRCWRRPLMPFVPSRHRHCLPHGRVPPSQGGLTRSVLCVARPTSPSLPLVWPISVSHVWKEHFSSCPHRPVIWADSLT